MKVVPRALLSLFSSDSVICIVSCAPSLSAGLIFPARTDIVLSPFEKRKFRLDRRPFPTARKSVNNDAATIHQKHEKNEKNPPVRVVRVARRE